MGSNVRKISLSHELGRGGEIEVNQDCFEWWEDDNANVCCDLGLLKVRGQFGKQPTVHHAHRFPCQRPPSADPGSFTSLSVGGSILGIGHSTWVSRAVAWVVIRGTQ